MSSGLIKQGIKYIFYPCIPYERTRVSGAQATTTTARSSPPMRKISKTTWRACATEHVRFDNPFIAFTNLETVTSGLKKAFPDIPASEVDGSSQSRLGRSWLTQDWRCTRKGQETLQYLKETGRHGIVLAGRPVPY